jgi:hypothetical protein
MRRAEVLPDRAIWSRTGSIDARKPVNGDFDRQSPFTVTIGIEGWNQAAAVANRCGCPGPDDDQLLRMVPESEIGGAGLVPVTSGCG